MILPAFLFSRSALLFSDVTRRCAIAIRNETKGARCAIGSGALLRV